MQREDFWASGCLALRLGSGGEVPRQAQVSSVKGMRLGPKVGFGHQRPIAAYVCQVRSAAEKARRYGRAHAMNVRQRWLPAPRNHRYSTPRNRRSGAFAFAVPCLAELQNPRKITLQHHLEGAACARRRRDPLGSAVSRSSSPLQDSPSPRSSCRGGPYLPPIVPLPSISFSPSNACVRRFGDRLPDGVGGALNSLRETAGSRCRRAVRYGASRIVRALTHSRTLTAFAGGGGWTMPDGVSW
jgi:hypothetical protein